MKTKTSKTLSPAQKAWVTRRKLARSRSAAAFKAWVTRRELALLTLYIIASAAK